LQSVAQAFAERSQMMFASSSTHKGNMAEILAGLEQAAGILGASKFDPQQANNALIVELRAIQDRLIEIPGLMANSMAPLMSSFIVQALAAGKTPEQAANIIKGLGDSAVAGANQAMPGFVQNNATPTETIKDAV